MVTPNVISKKPNEMLLVLMMYIKNCLQTPNLALGIMAMECLRAISKICSILGLTSVIVIVLSMPKFILHTMVVPHLFIKLTV